MTGGAGADQFVFGKGGGNDVVTDFDTALDRLFLEDGAQVKSFKVEDVNHDGIADLASPSNGSGAVTLLGVSSLSDVTFGDPSLALYGVGGSGGPENLSGYVAAWFEAASEPSRGAILAKAPAHEMLSPWPTRAADRRPPWRIHAIEPWLVPPGLLAFGLRPRNHPASRSRASSASARRTYC